MSEDKKVRVMTAKQFLNYSNKGKALASASGFLQAHREWLETGELADAVLPLLDKHDDDKEEALAVGVDTESLAKVTLADIQQAAVDHILAAALTPKERAVRITKAKEKVAKEPKLPKAWIVTIYNSKDEVQIRVSANGDEEEMIKGFDSSSEGDRWADRRLVFDCASDCYAVVKHSFSSLKTIILRNDAMYRIMRSKSGPASKRKPVNAKLAWGAKVKQSHASFSRG